VSFNTVKSGQVSSIPFSEGGEVRAGGLDFDGRKRYAAALEFVVEASGEVLEFRVRPVGAEAAGGKYGAIVTERLVQVEARRALRLRKEGASRDRRILGDFDLRPRGVRGGDVPRRLIERLTRDGDHHVSAEFIRREAGFPEMRCRREKFLVTDLVVPEHGPVGADRLERDSNGLETGAAHKVGYFGVNESRVKTIGGMEAQGKCAPYQFGQKGFDVLTGVPEKGVVEKRHVRHRQLARVMLDFGGNVRRRAPLDNG
jgi:hypothetical protein